MRGCGKEKKSRLIVALNQAIVVLSIPRPPCSSHTHLPGGGRKRARFSMIKLYVCVCAYVCVCVEATFIEERARELEIPPVRKMRSYCRYRSYSLVFPAHINGSPHFWLLYYRTRGRFNSATVRNTRIAWKWNAFLSWKRRST